MSSRVAQRHAAGSYDSCDSRVSASGRLAALVAALMIALATLFAGTAMPQQASAADDSQTNFDSWTAAAQNIAKQLATAEKDYNDGDYGRAGTGFQTAHWIGYDASNFSKAVNDTISADKQQALLTQFTDLEGLAYQQGRGGAIAGKIDALNADLTATAQTLDGNANLADPKTYAKQRAEQTAAERKKLDAAKKELLQRQRRPHVGRSRQRNERHPRQGIQGRHLRQGRGRLQPRQRRVLPVLRKARLRKERHERHLRRPRLAGRIPVQNDPQNHARRQFRQGNQEARRRPEKLARRRRGHPRRWRGRQRQRLHQSHHQLRRTGVPHPDPRGSRSAAGGGRRGGLPRQIRQPALHQVDLPRACSPVSPVPA